VNKAFSWIHYDWFLETFFLHNTMLLMSFFFLLFIILLILNYKKIKSEVNISGKTLAILFLIFLFGFYLRNNEYSYGIHTDGYMYSESAKFLKKYGIFIRDCAIGNLEHCRLYEEALFPPGYPYLITLAYSFFGMNSIYASVISAVFSSLTIITIFFVSYLLFKNEEVGLYSSLIFSLIPLDLFFANTGNVRPTGIFFLTLTTLFYLIALKKKDVKLWTLVVITLSLTIYMHHQNLSLIIPFGVGFLLLKSFRIKIEKIDMKFMIPVFIFILTQIPLIYWLISPSYKSPGNFFSIDCFIVTAPQVIHDIFSCTSIQFMEIKMLFHPFTNLLLITSLVMIIRKTVWKPIVFLWMMLMVFFFISTSYSYCYGKDYVRYIHILVFPYSLLSAISLFLLREKIGVKKEIFILLIFVFLLFTSGISFRLHMFKDMRTEKPKSAKVYFNAVNTTQNGCTIITSHYMIPTSDVFKNNRRRSINLWLIYPESEEYVLDEISSNECVLYFEDWFCKENQEYPCKFVEDKLNLSYVSTFEEYGNVINIYEVSLKS